MGSQAGSYKISLKIQFRSQAV